MQHSNVETAYTNLVGTMLASLQNRLALEHATSTKDDVTPSEFRAGLSLESISDLSHPAGHASSARLQMPPPYSTWPFLD